MSGNEKKYTLKPSWKAFLLQYLVCILLIPVFGIGLLVLLYVNSLHRNSFYQITDDAILISMSGKEPVSIKVAEVDSTRIEQNWLNRKCGISTLILTSQQDSNEYRMVGLREAQKLKSALDTAVKNERDRKEFSDEVQQNAPEYPSGVMDPINELVGMWQQGLITDEEFEQERKKFE